MDRKSLEPLSKAALIDLVLQQSERIEALTALVSSLEGRLSELERHSHRGAAPFAKPENNTDCISEVPKSPERL